MITNFNGTVWEYDVDENGDSLPPASRLADGRGTTVSSSSSSALKCRPGRQPGRASKRPSPQPSDGWSDEPTDGPTSTFRSREGDRTPPKMRRDLTSSYLDQSELPPLSSHVYEMREYLAMALVVAVGELARNKVRSRVDLYSAW